VNGGAKGRLAAPAMGLGGGMMDMAFHQPVLRQEVLERLAVSQEGLWVDATVGEGGHALAILEASARGRVLGIDRDPRGLDQATQRLRSYGNRFIPVQGSYAQMVELARSHGIAQADGVLLDLGISSRQVDAPGYGLSFQRDEPLDMRFDPAGQTATAAHIVNTYPEDELRRLLFQYGEEPQARAIARALVQHRPIHTTRELAELVARVTGPRRGRRINPATRTFQALRLAVNEELAHLEAGLKAAIALLAPGGRLVVISYHSLEDRLVKTTLAREAARCVCPPGLPVCVCGHQPTLRLVSRRAVRPTAEEVQDNPRSRSARLRAAQRLAGPNEAQ
jgi:16S rRNA (cytosine1402-N4)-methyltransferase